MRMQSSSRTASSCNAPYAMLRHGLAPSVVTRFIFTYIQYHNPRSYPNHWAASKKDQQQPESKGKPKKPISKRPKGPWRTHDSQSRAKSALLQRVGGSCNMRQLHEIISDLQQQELQQNLTVLQDDLAEVLVAVIQAAASLSPKEQGGKTASKSKNIQAEHSNSKTYDTSLTLSVLIDSVSGMLLPGLQTLRPVTLVLLIKILRDLGPEECGKLWQSVLAEALQHAERAPLSTDLAQLFWQVCKAPATDPWVKADLRTEAEANHFTKRKTEVDTAWLGAMTTAFLVPGAMSQIGSKGITYITGAFASVEGYTPPAAWFDVLYHEINLLGSFLFTGGEIGAILLGLRQMLYLDNGRCRPDLEAEAKSAELLIKFLTVEANGRLQITPDLSSEGNDSFAIETIIGFMSEAREFISVPSSKTACPQEACPWLDAALSNLQQHLDWCSKSPNHLLQVVDAIASEHCLPSEPWRRQFLSSSLLCCKPETMTTHKIAHFLKSLTTVIHSAQDVWLSGHDQEIAYIELMQDRVLEVAVQALFQGETEEDPAWDSSIADVCNAMEGLMKLHPIDVSYHNNISSESVGARQGGRSRTGRSNNIQGRNRHSRKGARSSSVEDVSESGSFNRLVPQQESGTASGLGFLERLLARSVEQLPMKSYSELAYLVRILDSAAEGSPSASVARQALCMPLFERALVHLDIELGKIHQQKENMRGLPGTSEAVNDCLSCVLVASVTLSWMMSDYQAKKTSSTLQSKAMRFWTITMPWLHRLPIENAAAVTAAAAVATIPRASDYMPPNNWLYELLSGLASAPASYYLDHRHQRPLQRQRQASALIKLGFALVELNMNLSSSDVVEDGITMAMITSLLPPNCLLGAVGSAVTSIVTVSHGCAPLSGSELSSNHQSSRVQSPLQRRYLHMLWRLACIFENGCQAPSFSASSLTPLQLLSFNKLHKPLSDSTAAGSIEASLMALGENQLRNELGPQGLAWSCLVLDAMDARPNRMLARHLIGALLTCTYEIIQRDRGECANLKWTEIGKEPATDSECYTDLANSWHEVLTSLSQMRCEVNKDQALEVAAALRRLIPDCYDLKDHPGLAAKLFAGLACCIPSSLPSLTSDSLLPPIELNKLLQECQPLLPDMSPDDVTSLLLSCRLVALVPGETWMLHFWSRLDPVAICDLSADGVTALLQGISGLHLTPDLNLIVLAMEQLQSPRLWGKVSGLQLSNILQSLSQLSLDPPHTWIDDMMWQSLEPLKHELQAGEISREKSSYLTGEGTSRRSEYQVISDPNSLRCQLNDTPGPVLRSLFWSLQRLTGGHYCFESDWWWKSGRTLANLLASMSPTDLSHTALALALLSTNTDGQPKEYPELPWEKEQRMRRQTQVSRAPWRPTGLSEKDYEGNPISPSSDAVRRKEVSRTTGDVTRPISRLQTDTIIGEVSRPISRLQATKIIGSSNQQMRVNQMMKEEEALLTLKVLYQSLDLSNVGPVLSPDHLDAEGMLLDCGIGGGVSGFEYDIDEGVIIVLKSMIKQLQPEEQIQDVHLQGGEKEESVSGKQAQPNYLSKQSISRPDPCILLMSVLKDRLCQDMDSWPFDALSCALKALVLWRFQPSPHWADKLFLHISKDRPESNQPTLSRDIMAEVIVSAAQLLAVSATEATPSKVEDSGGSPPHLSHFSTTTLSCSPSSTSFLATLESLTLRYTLNFNQSSHPSSSHLISNLLRSCVVLGLKPSGVWMTSAEKQAVRMLPSCSIAQASSMVSCLSILGIGKIKGRGALLWEPLHECIVARLDEERQHFQKEDLHHGGIRAAHLACMLASASAAGMAPPPPLLLESSLEMICTDVTSAERACPDVDVAGVLSALNVWSVMPVSKSIGDALLLAFYNAAPELQSSDLVKFLTALKFLAPKAGALAESATLRPTHKLLDLTAFEIVRGNRLANCSAESLVMSLEALQTIGYWPSRIWLVAVTRRIAALGEDLPLHQVLVLLQCLERSHLPQLNSALMLTLLLSVKSAMNQQRQDQQPFQEWHSDVLTEVLERLGRAGPNEMQTSQHGSVEWLRTQMARGLNDYLWAVRNHQEQVRERR